MTNSKKNVVRVLQAIADNNTELWKMARRNDGHKDLEDRYLREIMTLEKAIDLLTDRKYFNDIAAIYEVTEE